jgi:acetyl-CoA acyltransferase
MSNAVIVDVVRSASGKGKPGGSLSHLHPADLYSTILKALVERNGIDPATVDDVISGCVTQGGQQSANIARNALLGAGFPFTVPGTTIDRQCGSSQQAVAFAAQGIIAGEYDIVIAGGIEQMSRYPIGFAAFGENPHGTMLRENFPEDLVSQGISAELIAAQWGFSRDDLDRFSARSHQRAAAADFSKDIIEINGLTVDETIRPSTTVEGLGGLPAAFRDEKLGERFPQIEWNITPGNSSPLTDGASAALLMSEEMASKLGLTPRARVLHNTVVGSDPYLMLTGVIPATERILGRSKLTIDDMDSYEVNEAFAPVPLAWQRDVHADPEKLNPRGGAIAIGHPLGASGTRLLSTLIGTLEQTGGRYGLQTMCEGGGMANATIIERI